MRGFPLGKQRGQVSDLESGSFKLLDCIFRENDLVLEWEQNGATYLMTLRQDADDSDRLSGELQSDSSDNDVPVSASRFVGGRGYLLLCEYVWDGYSSRTIVMIEPSEKDLKPPRERYTTG